MVVCLFFFFFTMRMLYQISNLNYITLLIKQQPVLKIAYKAVLKVGYAYRHAIQRGKGISSIVNML